jgi:hypothetical protein
MPLRSWYHSSSNLYGGIHPTVTPVLLPPTLSFRLVQNRFPMRGVYPGLSRICGNDKKGGNYNSSLSGYPVIPGCPESGVHVSV